MADDDTTTERDDDGLPLEPAARRAAVEAQFDDCRRRIEALTPPEDTTMDDRDTAEPPPQAPRPPIKAALLAALEVSGAWETPAPAACELASVFQSFVVGLMKLDARHIPWVVALVDQFNRDVAEAICVLAPPTDTRH